MDDTRRIQDHALDESTDVTPQQFDEEGYVIGHPHHTAVADTDLGPDSRLIETDDELSEPDDTIVLDDAEASIAPPPATPDGPVPAAPDGAPPDITPAEPAPIAPDESVDPARTVGGQAF